MRVGFIGLGKLGLPMALAVESRGHKVQGWDESEAVRDIVATRQLPYKEVGAQELLSTSRLVLRRPRQIAEDCDLVFVAVQTPHQERYEGVTALDDTRADFDYSFLSDAINSVQRAKQIVVVSTVLPGTLGVRCGIWEQAKLLYNPSFIAMGTTVQDFLDPEFVLIGSDGAPTTELRAFYATIHDRPQFVTTIVTAELTKVAYNTFIGMKIVYANAMMEICEKVGADVDDLVDALSLAHRRIISPTYMRGGMGDGGGCHPRDNIALSWLAREIDLSYDIFTSMMEAREDQTEWIADLVADSEEIEIMGKAYKPSTNLTVGSPATLLANLLSERGVPYTHTDPHVEDDGP